MTKKIIATGFLLLGSLALFAQEKGHYLYVNGGGGLHNLHYELKDGTQQAGLGCTFNLGYNYFITPHWGIGTGLGVQSFLSGSKLNYNTSFTATDVDNEAYLFRTNYTDWEETQNAWMLDIPVGISYKTKLSQKWKLQTTLGGKISLPISAKYSTEAGSIQTTGFYPQYNAVVDEIPEIGFNTFTEFPSKDITLNPVISAYLDLGGLYSLNKNLDLYIGAYANYALNNAIDAQTSEVYQQTGGTYNGVFVSNQTDKVTPISFGLKLGLTWHAKCKKSVTTASPQLIQSKAIEAAPKPIEEAKPIIKEEPKPVIVPAPKPDPYVEARKIAVATDIKFAFDSKRKANDLKVIGDPQEEYLKQLAETLKANPDMKLRIVGHTCNISNHEINEQVGLKRAEVIKEKLLSYGVPESQLKTETRAYDEPLAPNTNEENRAKNRRVQLIVE